jgi:hypothetical protein
MRDVSFCFSEFANSFIGKTSSFSRGFATHSHRIVKSFFIQKKSGLSISITCSFLDFGPAPYLNDIAEDRQVFLIAKGVTSSGVPTPPTPNGNFFRYLCKFIIPRCFNGNFFRYFLLDSPKQAF